MPKIDKKQTKKLIQSLKKKSQSLINKQIYSQALQIYKKILILDPLSPKNHIQYIQMLIDYGEKIYYENLCRNVLAIFPNNFNILEACVNYLKFVEQYEAAEQIVFQAYLRTKQTQSLQYCIKLHILYGQVCYNCKFFSKSLGLIQKFEHENKQQLQNNQQILQIKIKLLYEMGEYKKTIDCCDNYQKQDKKCEYSFKKTICYILLNNFRASKQTLNNISTNEPNIQKKVTIFKAYCSIKLLEKQEAKQFFKSRSMNCKNSPTLSLKLNLIEIHSLEILIFPNCQSIRIQKRLKQLLKYFQTFTKNKFKRYVIQDEFFSYNQFCIFVKNLKYFTKIFGNPNINFGLMKQFSNLLFLSMHVGYYDLVNINYQLETITEQIQKIQP